MTLTCPSLARAARTPVFDLAAPPVAHADILRALPRGAAVLLQKPMGLDLDAATLIRGICRERRLIAAANFQLRFVPMMIAVADVLHDGLLGRLVDVEVHLNLVTPWHLFPHLKPNPRVEIVSHSIHYLDMIRAVAGNPVGVLARTYGHPDSDLAQTRTTAILDYGRDLRAGEPDELWIAPKGGPWEPIQLTGRWFPDAFIGTMALVEAGYRSNDFASTPVPTRGPDEH